MWFKACKDYDRRVVGCHGSCPDYIKAKAKSDLVNLNRIQESIYLDYVSEATLRMKKSRNPRGGDYR